MQNRFIIKVNRTQEGGGSRNPEIAQADSGIGIDLQTILAGSAEPYVCSNGSLTRGESWLIR